ncbi:MAG: hypothetical protein ABIJ97_01490 [Bacteroidota bacterium]
MEYSVKRTHYVKGTYKTLTYWIQNDSIVVTKYSTNGRPPKLVYSNILNTKQKNKLAEILNSFDLPKMENEYIDENVEGEGHYVYDIKIGQDFKSILVYFVVVPDLKKLDVFINELILPVDQNSWYEWY